jgi:hypothetical protein
VRGLYVKTFGNWLRAKRRGEKHAIKFPALIPITINQVSGRLRHVPPTARGTKSTPLAGKGHQFIMGAACTTQA